LILLSGDVESNPGPGPASSIFYVCTFNIRSLTNHFHYTALADLAQTHNVDIFALTETWISPNTTTSAELLDSIPHGFHLVSTPRPVTSSKTSNVDGGTAFLVREPLSLLSSPTFTFKSFEVSTVTLKLPRSKLTICNIYHPPPTSAVSRNKSTFSQFLEDFQCLVSTVTTLPHEFIITGDFNIHVDNATDSYTQQFLSVLNDANLTQHVTFPTHSHSHTLDLFITGINSSLRPSITPINTSPSDHFPVLSTLNITPPPPPPLSKVTYRSIKSVNVEKFKQDILSSSLITHPPIKLSDLVDCYNYTLSSILDKHAPVKTKFTRLKPANPSFTPALNKPLLGL
jgi:exonuclease III